MDIRDIDCLLDGISVRADNPSIVKQLKEELYVKVLSAIAFENHNLTTVKSMAKYALKTLDK